MEIGQTSECKWEFRGEDPECQVLASVDEASGSKRYVEDPFNPDSEAIETLSQRLPDIGVLLTCPCSAKTINAIKDRAQDLKSIIIVDTDETRLSLWREKLLEDVGEAETLLLPKDTAKAALALREHLSNFECGLFLGKCAVYIPQRFRRIEKDFSAFLESSVLQLQREACSLAATKSAKSWRKTLNQLMNTSFRNTLKVKEPLESAPVVVVGAGPSLDNNIDTLRKYADRATIIATDGALNSLLKAGVVPDMAASTDAALHCWRYFAAADARLKDIMLAASINSGSSLLKLYPGRVSLFAEDAIPSWLAPFAAGLPRIKHGQCVGHFAFHLAETLQPEEIILVGFDLAYRDGRFHPKDMPYKYSEEFKDSFRTNMVEVDAASGGKVKTDLSMSFYLSYFERAFAASPYKVIDATEGGARKRGASIKSLHEALSKKPSAKKPIWEQNLLYTNFDSHSELARLKDALSALKPELSKVESALSSMDHTKPGNPLMSLPLSSPQFELLSSFCNFLLLSRYADLLTNYRPGRFASFKDTAKLLLEDMKVSLDAIDTAMGFMTSPPSLSPDLRMALVPDDEDDIRTARDAILRMDNLKAEIPASTPLHQIWLAMAREGAGAVLAFDGAVIADVWELPGASCTDIKTRFEPKPHERSLWVPGYSLACIDSHLLLQWRNFVPPDVDCQLLPT